MTSISISPMPKPKPVTPITTPKNGPAVILEQQNENNQSMLKDPFYGPLLKYLKKKHTKMQKNGENLPIFSYQPKCKFVIPKVPKPVESGNITPDSNSSKSSSRKRQISSSDESEKSSFKKPNLEAQNQKVAPVKKEAKKEPISEIKAEVTEKQPGPNYISNMAYTYSSREADNQVSNFNYTNPAFRNLIHIDTHPNGRATTLHAYQDEINNYMQNQKMSKFERQTFNQFFQEDFCKLAISERHLGEPYFVLAVLHNGAKELPEPMYYLSKQKKDGVTNIKYEKIDNKKDVSTISIKNYFRLCRDNYNISAGTVKIGPMRAVSLVGKTGEEVSIYNTDYIAELENIPMLKALLPWGTMSIYPDTDPTLSNDGPILWCRPGEQILLPSDLNSITSGTDDANLVTKRRKVLVGKLAEKSKSEDKIEARSKTVSVIDNALMIGQMQTSGRRNRETREKIIDDFTPAHADHVDETHLRQTAHAVGILKHPNYTNKEGPNRPLKKVIAFDARSFYDLIEPLEINLLGMPANQCTKFIDHQRLTFLRAAGIKYSEFELYDNDIYIIPRYVVHQFRSVAHVSSMAWHVRIKGMHLKDSTQLEEIKNIHTELNNRRQQLLLKILETDKNCFFSSDEENLEKVSSPKRKYWVAYENLPNQISNILKIDCPHNF